MLHKDIKPSNILIYRGSDGEPLPRLTDFGIGELTDPTQLANRNITLISGTDGLDVGNETSNGTGTRMYAPPELLMGKPFTIQGDVYSLGVLLYQMVVGDLDRPLAQGWERDVPDLLLRDDISRCVEGSEAQRLDSAKELADRLQNLPTRRRALRRRRIARISVAVSIVLVGLLGVSSIWLIRERSLRAVAEHEKDKALAVIKFIPGIFGAVDPRAGEVSGRDVKVADRLDEAVRKLDGGELAHEPEIEALARSTIGAAYKSLSQYKEAEQQFATSLKIRRDVLPTDHPEIADSLEELSGAKWFLGHYQDAATLAQECYEMRLRRFGEDSLEVASSLNYLAAALDKLDQHDEAERLFRRALAIRQQKAQGIDRELVARSMNNLGTCLRDQGPEKQREAEQLLRDSIELVKQLRGSEYVDVANGLSNLGSFYLKTKQYERAEQSYNESLTVKRKVYGDVHSSIAVTLHGLADVYFHLQKHEQAEVTAANAVAVREATIGGLNRYTIESRDLLGKILETRQKFDDAILVLRQSLDARLQSGRSDELEIGDCESRLGNVLCLAGKPEEGEPLLVSGFERLRAGLPRKDPRAIAAGKKLIEQLKRTNRSEDADAIEATLPTTTVMNARPDSS